MKQYFSPDCKTSLCLKHPKDYHSDDGHDDGVDDVDDVDDDDMLCYDLDDCNDCDEYDNVKQHKIFHVITIRLDLILVVKVELTNLVSTVPICASEDIEKVIKDHTAHLRPTELGEVVQMAIKL